MKNIIIESEGNIIVDMTRVGFEVSTENKKAIDSFFKGFSSYSKSNELVMTYLGRPPEEGGKVVIGWNQLNSLIWALLNEVNVADKPE